MQHNKAAGRRHPNKGAVAGVKASLVVHGVSCNYDESARNNPSREVPLKHASSLLPRARSHLREGVSAIGHLRCGCDAVVLGLFGFPLFILFVAHVFEVLCQQLWVLDCVPVQNRLDSGKVKHAFHRLGAVASLLLALRSLDSRGFNILRPGLLVTFLNSNLTSCLFIACNGQAN